MVAQLDTDVNRSANLRVWSARALVVAHNVAQQVTTRAGRLWRRVLPHGNSTEPPASQAVVVGGRVGRALAVAGTLSRRPSHDRPQHDRPR